METLLSVALRLAFQVCKRSNWSESQTAVWSNKRRFITCLHGSTSGRHSRATDKVDREAGVGVAVQIPRRAICIEVQGLEDMPAETGAWPTPPRTDVECLTYVASSLSGRESGTTPST